MNAGISAGRCIDGLERRWMARRRRDFGAGMRIVEAGGARLRVRVWGRGEPTLVFAADPPNVIEHHFEVAEALATRRRVVCFELPGFGFSTAPAGFDFSIASNARVVGALLDELGLAPYALAMPCVSGLVGATVAASRPGIVSHVIGVQTGGIAGMKAWAHRVDRGVLRREGIGQAIVLATRRRLARAWFDVALADPGRREAFVALVADAFDAGATYPLASALQALGRLDAVPRPAQPTLLVWGTRDPTHRRTARDELSPGARVVALESAGHFPDLEDIAGFVAATNAFLGSHVVVQDDGAP
jgi:pimeloyl-ACP methyl ester carboxylesterase